MKKRILSGIFTIIFLQVTGNISAVTLSIADEYMPSYSLRFAPKQGICFIQEGFTERKCNPNSVIFGNVIGSAKAHFNLDRIFPFTKFDLLRWVETDATTKEAYYCKAYIPDAVKDNNAKIEFNKGCKAVVSDKDGNYYDTYNFMWKQDDRQWKNVMNCFKESKSCNTPQPGEPRKTPIDYPKYPADSDPIKTPLNW